MRNLFIAGNWKMYKTTAEAKAFAEEFRKIVESQSYGDTRIAVCAPFTQLAALKELFQGTKIEVGAQNVHAKDEGAYTGEISLPMLKELQLDDVIIGHSERRQYFNETDEAINQKLMKILRESNMTPILCVGENLEERESSKQEEVVSRSLKLDLEGLAPEEAARVVIAYEPIWAIGTGKTATSEQAEEMCAFIRSQVKDLFGDDTAEKILIQYGGSVKPENAAEILGMPDIDGALVGGASLDPEKFAAILAFTKNAC